MRESTLRTSTQLDMAKNSLLAEGAADGQRDATTTSKEKPGAKFRRPTPSLVVEPDDLAESAPVSTKNSVFKMRQSNANKFGANSERAGTSLKDETKTKSATDPKAIS